MLFYQYSTNARSNIFICVQRREKRSYFQKSWFWLLGETVRCANGSVGDTMKSILIKYENLARSNVAKTLAIYLTKENPALCHIYVRDKVYDVPKNEEGVREFAEIRETFQKFLESLDD